MSSGSGYQGIFYPLVASYKYDCVGTTVYGHQQYHTPPSKPLLIALTNNVRFRQASVGYDVRPNESPGTVEYVGGHIEPAVVVAIPEINSACDVSREVEKAKVRRFVALAVVHNFSVLLRSN